MEIIDYPDRDLQALALARQVASDLRAALVRRERAVLAVPGGTTPGALFDLLGGQELDWSRITVLPTDERWVAPEDPRANARLIRGRLLTEAAAAARFVPLWVAADSPEDAAPALERAVAELLPLDVLVLGMGTDGHIASLFPGGDRLDAALAPDAPPVLAMRAPAAAEPRLTLTLPVLRGAFAAHLLITGADKRAVLARARGADPRTLPVAAMLDMLTVHWAA
jgi:6-phosphogluconolactonase